MARLSLEPPSPFDPCPCGKPDMFVISEAELLGNEYQIAAEVSGLTLAALGEVFFLNLDLAAACNVDFTVSCLLALWTLRQQRQLKKMLKKEQLYEVLALFT